MKKIFLILLFTTNCFAKFVLDFDGGYSLFLASKLKVKSGVNFGISSYFVTLNKFNFGLGIYNIFGTSYIVKDTEKEIFNALPICITAKYPIGNKNLELVLNTGVSLTKLATRYGNILYGNILYYIQYAGWHPYVQIETKLNLSGFTVSLGLRYLRTSEIKNYRKLNNNVHQDFTGIYGSIGYRFEM